jgi:hypothetical protein
MVIEVEASNDTTAITLPVNDAMLPLDDKSFDLGPFEPQWLRIEHDETLLPRPFPKRALPVDQVQIERPDITLDYDPRWLDVGTEPSEKMFLPH